MKKRFGKKAIFFIIGIFLLGMIFLVLTRFTPLHKTMEDALTKHVYYQNNVPLYDINAVNFDENDVREVQISHDKTTLINHSRGFALSFPKDAKYDFSAAQEYISVDCSNLSAVVSKEYSTFPDGAEESKKYVANYLHKYMLDETYLSENNIKLYKNDFEEINGFPVQIVALQRTPAKTSPIRENAYVYCYIYTDTNVFYRIMFKAESYTDALLEEVYNTLYSFRTDIPVRGISDTFTDFYPTINEKWNKETKALYDALVNGESVKWGIFVPWAVGNNDFSNIHALEKKIGAKFDGVLEYMYHDGNLPKEGMKKAYDEGKTIELTLQTSTVMNANLNGKNPVFDILDGKFDAKLKTLAKEIKNFGHPILFRLNNEMNSDWTSYSASACLTDPELYVTLWRKVYHIFEEEGVDNAIWIFNPNEENFPPNGYNTSLAYYPGNEYVHLFGITGYNTGTYYDELNGESWRSFDEIYSRIHLRYARIYGEFPWIITEFASSSVGGDKAKWITEMFYSLENYPNIKMAFWFNSADYDERPESMGNVARPYWLDETPDTARAFSSGIRAKQK